MIAIATGSVTAVWRQRGYNDAVAKRRARPPADDEAAAAYRGGYRQGELALERRAAGEL